MNYSEKFTALADAAKARVQSVEPEDVDSLIADGAIALDIRDSEEHQKGHIAGSMNVSRGKREMIIERKVPDINTTLLCYCNAFNRGALSTATLNDMGYKNAKMIAGGLNAYKALSQ